MSGRRSRRLRYPRERAPLPGWPPVLVFWVLLAGAALYLLGEHRVHALGVVAYLPALIAVLAPVWLHRALPPDALVRPARRPRRDPLASTSRTGSD